VAPILSRERTEISIAELKHSHAESEPAITEFRRPTHPRTMSVISKIGPDVEILYTKTDHGQNIVKAGTIEKLLERLLDPTAHGI
jgi:hypothetical protein